MARMPNPNPALTPAARAFLQDPMVVTIATVDADGAPRQAVAWYRVEPDDRILVNSRSPRRWPANLLRDPRASLAVVDPSHPDRWVGLTVTVDEVVDDVDRAREDIVELAHRYRTEGPTDASLAAFRSQPRVSFLLRVTGVHDHLEDD
jgi:PPOX class probable F420-dependent enzyme